MSAVFLSVLNRGLVAGWVILAVLLLRALLRRAPRRISPLLWGLVALRLLCPSFVQSPLSLLPSAAPVRLTASTDPTPSLHTGIPAINSVADPLLQRAFAPEPTYSADPLQIWIPILTALWLAGAAVLLLYGAIRCGRLRLRLRTAIRLRDNIYRSEYIGTPCVLGVLRPHIYLPVTVGEEEQTFILAHEQAHIRRKDHWWKLLGFLLLAFFWFQPLMWLAYSLFCRDLELACDESVIRRWSPAQRADYSQTLLSCSAGRRAPWCPLAFGEVGVKSRIQAVLRYRSPSFWVIAVAVLALAGAAVGFLTDPVSPICLSAAESGVYAARMEAATAVWVSDQVGFCPVPDVRRHQIQTLAALEIDPEPALSLPDSRFFRGFTLVLQSTEEAPALDSRLQGLYVTFSADLSYAALSEDGQTLSAAYAIRDPKAVQTLYDDLYRQSHTDGSAALFAAAFADSVYATEWLDIDGDGRREQCVLCDGPTSGLLTFLVAAYDNGQLEYCNLFVGDSGAWFQTDAHGKMRLAYKPDGQLRFLDIRTENRQLRLYDEGEALSYWGGQGICSGYAPRTYP